MPFDTFKSRLAKHLNIDLELIINDNRCTMLNLLEKSKTSARLSVHKMFLEAPDPVISAIAHYIRGSRKESSVLRQYIQEHLQLYDYTHQLKTQQLSYVGKTYHLKQLFHEINKKYFNQELDLAITWFGGQKKRRRTTRITFGQYLSGLRLIKIHRMLDDPFFPEYFVAFIVYHEMLHSVISGSVDHRGRYCYHTHAFKEKERAFEDYERAIEWEKHNKEIFFRWG